MSFGMPRSSRTCFWMRRTGRERHHESITKEGMKLNILAFSRIVICGACAALANMLRTSPDAPRLRVRQVEAAAVQPFLWAMWSMASTT
jgi:hypothetical protein